jgi:hypothetical protein
MRGKVIMNTLLKIIYTAIIRFIEAGRKYVSKNNPDNQNGEIISLDKKIWGTRLSFISMALGVISFLIFPGLMMIIPIFGPAVGKTMIIALICALCHVGLFMFSEIKLKSKGKPSIMNLIGFTCSSLVIMILITASILMIFVKLGIISIFI